MISNCGIHVLLKQYVAKEKGRGTKRMVNCRELRLKCEECNKHTMWNVNKVCNECEKDNRSEMRINNNNNEQEGNERCDGESDKVKKKKKEIEIRLTG